MSDWTKKEESAINDLANTFVSLGKSECAATLRITAGIIVNRLNQRESELLAAQERMKGLEGNVEFWKTKSLGLERELEAYHDKYGDLEEDDRPAENA